MGHSGQPIDHQRPEQKVCKHIEAWQTRPIEGEHPDAYLDGIVLKLSWASEVRNVSVLVSPLVWVKTASGRCRGLPKATRRTRAVGAGFRSTERIWRLKGCTADHLGCLYGSGGGCAGVFFGDPMATLHHSFLPERIQRGTPRHVRTVSDMPKVIHAGEDRQAVAEDREGVGEMRAF